MASPCVYTYKGKDYTYEQFASMLHDGLLDEMIMDNTITLDEKELLTPESNPALKDVESTAKALEGKLSSEDASDYLTIYNGSPKDVKSLGKRSGVTYFATEKAEADYYAEMNRGEVREFKIKKSDLVDEDFVLNKIQELELTPKDEAYSIEDGLLYELIDDRFDNSLSKKDIKKLFAELKKEGVKAFEYTDGSQVSGRETTSIAIIDSDQVLKSNLLADNPKSTSEAYHKAKADGSNPELVKAVEELLAPESNADKITTAVEVPRNETPRATEEVAKGVTEEVQPVAKEKVDRNTILDLKDKWNSIPKKDRAVVGANLRAKIDAQAKELGFEIVQDKGGKIKVVQKGGKAVNRSPVKLTEEQRAEAKARAEQIKRVKNQTPNDLRQAILQYFLGGGKGIKMADVTRNTGFKSANDFAPFTVSQDGRSMHSLWEEMKGDPEISHLINDDNSVFENEFFDVLTEYADRESMWRDLLDYDAESNWREQGFTSQHQYESYLFSKMEAAKEGLAPDALTQDMFEQAMAEVEAMPDEAVETLLRELDEVSPKTQEELNNFYNENNIEKAESSAKEGTTDSQVSGAKGEDLNEVRKQVIEEEAQAVSEKELKKAQEDYLKAKEEFDRKAKEVDERIADSQQQEIFAQEKPENPLDVEIDASKRGKAVEESKVKLDQAKQKLSDLQGRREKAKAEAMKKIDDFEQWALNLPGIKDMSGGAEKAGLGAAEVIKGITQAVREAVEAGFDLADAVTDAIAKFKKTAPEIIEAITEDKILQRFGVEKELFSAKNESTKKFREKYGIPEDVEVTAQVRRDHKMVIESAKALRDKGVNPLELADRVITERYMLTPEEQHLMLENEIALDNERRDIEKKIEKIDPEQIERADIAKMFTRLEEIRFEQSMMFTALERAGTEQSLVFRMRQLALNRAYSVEGFKRSYKAVRGEEAPQALVDKVQKQADIIHEAQERIKELEPTLREQQMQEIIESLQEQLEREKKKPSSSLSKEKQARKTELKKKFAGMFNDATNIPALLADKEFIEYAGLVLEETARDFAKFAKKLVEEMGPKIEPHTKEIYDAINKRSFEKAYVKDGRIRIDKNLLLSVVEGGVKDHKDFLQQVYDIVKEDLPDVTEREVADAVSGYGKIIDSKLTDLERELNSIKRDLKLASGLEDVRAGKGVLRSGFQPPKPTDEQRRVMREIREEMKNYPEDEAQVQKKWTTALGKIKQTLENSIKDTQKRIDDLKAGIPAEKTERKRVQLDEKATQLREQLDDLKAQLKELEGPKTLSDEQLVKNAIAAAEKSEREYNRRTSEIRSTGAYTPTIKRSVSSPELDMARNARDRAKEDFDRALATTDYAKQAATQKALASAEEALAKLENKIARGDLSYRQKVMGMVDQTNPLLVAAKEKIKLQNNILKAMREASGEAERHMQEIWTKRKENSIKEIEQKIANKDYTKKIRKETPLTEEMIRLKAKEDRAKFTFEVAMEKARLEARSRREKSLDMLLELGTVPKSINASLDLSGVGRQGGMISSRHPITAITKGIPEMLKQMKSKEYAQEWHHRLVETDDYIVAKRSGLFLNEPMAKLAAMEEEFASRLADFLPGVAASNRAYSGYLNVMRMEAFTKFRDALLQSGYKGAELQRELTNYATFINNATGRGKLPKFGSKFDVEMAAPMLNSFFFSPRFLASRIRILASPLTLLRSSPKARIAAYKVLGSYALTVGATLQMLKLAGATVGSDPRSSDFEKAKIGDTTYDFWAGLQQPVVLVAKFLSGTYVSKGVEKEIGEGQNLTYAKLLGKFLRSKASPVSGAIYDKMEGKFYDGSPFDAKQLPEKLLLPMMVQDLREMYGKENIGLDGVKWNPEGAALAASNVVPMMLGVGVQYMEPSEIIEKSNLRPRVENLVKKHKYQPKNNYDRDYYLDGKKMEVTDQQMEKIEKLRLKYAGEMINRADFDGLTTEAFDKKMDGFYNKALRKAQKEVLGNKAKQRE
jgi:hypothetical protein